MTTFRVSLPCPAKPLETSSLTHPDVHFRGDAKPHQNDNKDWSSHLGSFCVL